MIPDRDTGPGRSTNRRAAIRCALSIAVGAFLTPLATAADEGKAAAETKSAKNGGGVEVRFEPALSTVPANHLKFYLYFPEPMERGSVMRHLRLMRIDQQGEAVKEVPEPFRGVELWDESFTRLTVWFHPGRQKPGVNLNLDIGPVLDEGERYRLEVLSSWRSESGAPVAEGQHHEFVAGPPDEERPDPEQWTFRQEDPSVVTVRAGEALDPVSLNKRVSVRDAEGRSVGARLEVFADGFRLRRESGWEPGEYRLVVDPQLEDLAGNTVSRPFNVDLQAGSGYDLEPDPVERTFRIGSAEGEGEADE